MSDIRQHADAVKQLAGSFRSMIALGDYLDGIASLELQQQEATTARDAAVTARDAAQAAAAKADQLVVAAQDRLAQAQDDAAATERQAHETATRIVTEGTRQAQSVVDAATQRAADLDAARAAAMASFDELTIRVAVRRGEVAQLDAQMAALKQAALGLAQ